MVVPVKYDCSNRKIDSEIMEDTKQTIQKDIIGNSKEFRIDCNKSNLRIIGNNNRVVIKKNYGDLNIIGNSTNIKITFNNGSIKYTGNSGKIYLGSDSAQTKVEYIGCNGILKVIKDLPDKLNKTKSPNSTRENMSQTDSHKSPLFKEEDNHKTGSSRSNKNVHNSGGLYLSIKNTISLPNLSSKNLLSIKTASIANSITLSHSNGDIVIKNDITF